MNVNTQVCQVCKVPLTLSRRQIHAISVEVRKVAKNRFFVPDDEVHQIIHRIHTKVESQANG